MDIVEKILDVLIDGIKKEKNNSWRLQKAVEAVQTMITPTKPINTGPLPGKTLPKEKKRKQVKKRYIINDIIPVIALFLPYPDFFNFILVEKRFKNLVDINWIWEKKFETEFSGYTYPLELLKDQDSEVNIEGVSQPINWKIASEILLEEFKDIQRFYDRMYEMPTITFKILGNELLLKQYSNYGNHYYYAYIAMFLRDWEKNKNRNFLNVQLMIDLLENESHITMIYDFSKVINLEKFFEGWTKKKIFLKGLVNALFKSFSFNCPIKIHTTDFFRVQNYFFRDYSVHFKEELKDKKILIKLLKMGIFVDKDIYDGFMDDNSFILELEKIDYFLPTLVKYDKNVMNAIFVAIYGFGRSPEGFSKLSEEFRNSYIINLLSVRSSGQVFYEVLPKFKDNFDIAMESIRPTLYNIHGQWYNDKTEVDLMFTKSASDRVKIIIKKHLIALFNKYK